MEKSDLGLNLFWPVYIEKRKSADEKKGLPSIQRLKLDTHK